MRTALLLLLTLLLVSPAFAQKRRIQPADVYRLQTLASPQVSPDGRWVCYLVRSVDSVKDNNRNDLWMMTWDGKESVRLTYTFDGVSNPRWSPDGRYISFIARQGDAKNSQIYTMDRRGGEPQKLTDIKGSIQEYAWSPDGSRIVLSMEDPDFSDTSKTRKRNPYVIDRYQFKQDYSGYLDSGRTHLYVYHLAAKRIDTLTQGIYNETNPCWSPDNSRIAFTSNRTDNPDKNDNTDIFVMEARPGAPLNQLTTWKGSDVLPLWSPNGREIAYLQSSSNEPFNMYGQQILAVVPAAGGNPRLLTAAADRPVRNHRWSPRGGSLVALMSDDRQCYPVEIDLNSGTVKKLDSGEKSYSDMESNSVTGSWLVKISTPAMPPELFALENNSTRQLTHVSDSFLAPLQLAKVEGFNSKSKDGTRVGGLLYRYTDSPSSSRLPLVLFIHGGPVSQDEYQFDLTRQVLAAAGYAVAGVNYRGSNGRGLSYIRSIYADWGNKEVMDIRGAADYLVAAGVADENRLGIGGWSYGGISTNYTIATDPRFKAAVSGAGSALQLSMYGTDQYISQYETELGVPWKNLDKWIKLSYPFFQVERIKTPTLFMASQNDFNVPVAGAEQMYQALKSQGVPTQLVIYPGQYHVISVPSYIKDRLERHINWYDRYLK